MEHNIPDASQDPVEQLLQSAGREPAELRPEIKILHKQQLLSLAERLQKEAAETLFAAEHPTEPAHQRWWKQLRTVLVGTGAGFAVAACALLLFLNIRQGQPGVSGSIDALGRVLVPAAQATDAFQVYTDTDAPKVADQSSLILRSKVALSPDQVQRVLQVDTGHIAEVEKVSADSFRVRLASVPSNKVVRVAMAAAIQTGSSTEETASREYSWAVQTTDQLELVSSLPANNANEVPLDASLELVLNAQGFTNVTSSLEITPDIKGTIQVNGRRIVFIPAEPWKATTLYTVRLKQGLAAEQLSLPADLTLQFQTGAATGDSNVVPVIRVASEFQEAYVGEVVSVPLTRSPGLASSASTISVTGYRLTEDEAAQFLAKRLPYSYVFGSTDRVQDYTSFAKVEAFKADLPITRPSENAGELITLPKFTEQGWFLIRLNTAGVETWMFTQVTNLASYVVADKDQLVVWAVNADTKQALTNLPVRMDAATAVMTDGSGLAHLPAPAFLGATTTLAEPQVSILHLGDANSPLRALAVIGPSSGVNLFERSAPGHDATWGYAFPDRPLYRTSDEMKVTGIVQDRVRTTAVGQVELRLTKPSYAEDLMDGRDRTYASTLLTLDAAGRYEALLSWKNISPGYYQLDLVRNGTLVISRYIEVRAFVKPAYFVNVDLSAKQLFAGQEAQAHIQAQFYNGAPLPKAHFTLRVTQGDVKWPDQAVTLDDQGELTLPIKTLPVLCNDRLADTCHNTEPLLISLYPMEGEEAQILGSAQLDVKGSELDLRGEVKETDGTALLELQTYHRDLGKEGDETGAVWSGRTLRGQVMGVHYEKIQDGVWYDAFEKRVVPYYRYERRQDPPMLFSVVTDGNGRANYRFPMQTDRDFYEVTVQGEDVSNRFTRFTTTAARGWYTQDAASEASPHLTLEGKGTVRDVQVGEILKPTFQFGTTTYQAEQGPGVLFFTLSRGIKQAVRSPSASWETTYTNELLPNATIRGVTFANKRFVSAETVVFLDKEAQQLDVQVTTDKHTYHPGEKTTIHIQVKPQANQLPLTDVKVAYALVDESVLSLAGFYEEDPLQWINNYVSDGTLFQRTSHSGDWLQNGEMMEKGAGGGGGPGDAATQGTRRLFKDVAGTGFVTVDADGKATAEVTLPDNLTSWRLTAVALGSDLRAGATKTSIQVSKEVFVDAVIPSRLLATDEAVLKLRAFGTGVEMGKPLTFSIDAPTLGLTQYVATGTAGTPLYVAVPALKVGTHRVTLSVSQGSFSDRLERTLQVEATRITRLETVSVDPSPGMTLGSGMTDTVDLVVTSPGRASLYPALRDLAGSRSLRADARVAAALARQLLQASYGESLQTEDASLLDIQTTEEGGIHLLPYGSSETALSLQVALTDPDAIDAWQLRAFFADKLAHGASRLERLQALAGLAALGAPVVLDLQQAATLTDRTPEETLTIIEGLVSVGDIERAGELMRQLLTTSTLRDGQRFIQIGTESSPGTYEATTEAAALAERLLLPQAEQLHAFVEQNWSAEAYPILAKARYLAFRLQHVPAEEGSLQWTDGLRTETVNLKDTPLKTIALSPDEFSHFRILSVSGPVRLSYLHAVPGLPSMSPSLSLTRTYSADKPLDQLTEGDEVTISLQPHFASSSLDGCALVQDDLPANLLALSAMSLEKQVPLFIQENTTSFITCKNDPSPTISYRAKVIARGTYRAEPALMQRLDTPSVATYSLEQRVTVR